MINKVSVKGGYFTSSEHRICSFSVFSARKTFYKVGKLQAADTEDVGGMSDAMRNDTNKAKVRQEIQIFIITCKHNPRWVCRTTVCACKRE